MLLFRGEKKEILFIAECMFAFSQSHTYPGGSLGDEAPPELSENDFKIRFSSQNVRF